MMELHDSIAEALGTDFFGLREGLTAQQLDYLTRARAFVDNDVLPVINDYWERAEVPWPLIEKLGTLNLVGDTIEGYGCPPMDPLSAGLISMELGRGDGSVGTFLGVHCGLAMKSIYKLGSEEQNQRFLPEMATLQ